MAAEAPKKAPFDVSFDNGMAHVKREFTFQTAQINFNISLPIQDEMTTVTVADLHQRSVRRAIELLQGLIPQEK